MQRRRAAKAASPTGAFPPSFRRVGFQLAPKVSYRLPCHGLTFSVFTRYTPRWAWLLSEAPGQPALSYLRGGRSAGVLEIQPTCRTVLHCSGDCLPLANLLVSQSGVSLRSAASSVLPLAWTPYLAAWIRDDGPHRPSDR